jgi:hypothetical protein
MRRSLPALLALLAAFSLALLAGCGDEEESTAGGSDGGSSTAANTASGNGQFAEEANAICEKHKKQIAKRARELSVERVPGAKPPTPAEISQEMLQKAVAPQLEAEAEEIRALDIPEESADQVNQMLASMQKTIAEGEENPAAFSREVQPFKAAEQLAKDGGMPACGGPGLG